MSQTIITLTFTANTDTLHQPLDSVLVENTTQGGDTMLHYPDTVLLLDHGVAVFDPQSNTPEGLMIYPSFPNPFNGRTTTRFFLPEKDVVTIRVYDLLGRELAALQQTLPAGAHTFILYAGSEKHCLLVVETPNERRVQKLINLGGDEVFRIEHTGSDQYFSGFRKGKSGFPWIPGDQLKFTGYATLYGNITVSDTLVDDPVLSSSYIFQFTEPWSQPYPFGYIHCDPFNPTGIVDVINPLTGRTWMDRNLGASQVATWHVDTLAYGDLFQWGRFADGHQCRNSAATATPSSTNQPGHGNFIMAPNTPGDWRIPQNHTLWQGVNGINNPCPAGYRLPNEAELNAERQTWNGNGGFHGSPLKLPMAGLRNGNDGTTFFGSTGHYWSGTVSGSTSKILAFTLVHEIGNLARAWGGSVRCIKDY
jgi:hypothetical protein